MTRPIPREPTQPMLDALYAPITACIPADNGKDHDRREHFELARKGWRVMWDVAARGVKP